MTYERRTVLAGLAGLTATATTSRAALARNRRSYMWTFDNFDEIGGLKPHVEGNPQLIDSPFGKATLFDGVDDAIFIDKHPLAGARTFAFEAYFRPDGGQAEQRWFYLGEPVEPKWVNDLHKAPRFTFEIRVVGDQWYLDAFVFGPGYTQGLMFADRLHPLGQWFHVAQTYDGKTYRSYVNGVLQGEAPLAYVPQRDGRSSIGTRINRQWYFKGAVRAARFSRHYLEPKDFLPPPA